MYTQKFQNRIYAKSCDGGKDMLLSCVRIIDGELCLTYEKGDRVLAYKSLNEVVEEAHAIEKAS